MSDVPREFVFTRYPGRQGMVWLRTAYLMFSQHRGSWILLFVAYALIGVFLRVLPYVGTWIFAVSYPVFAVGILAAAWNEERGEAPAMKHLLQGFHSNLKALLAVGLFLLAGLMLAQLLTSAIDGGKLPELMAVNEPMTEETLKAQLSDTRLQLGLLVSLVLAVLLVIATWWASGLIVFQDATPTAAVATTFRAGLSNWRAILVYGLGLLFYGGIVPATILLILTLVVPQPALQLLMIALLGPYLLIFAVTLHVSYYVSYRDVFHANETLAPLSRNT